MLFEERVEWRVSIESKVAIDTHIITSRFALPLLIKNPGGLVVEMTDGTAEYKAVWLHRSGRVSAGCVALRS